MDKIKQILLLAGGIEIFIGLLHFIMPYYIYIIENFRILQKIELDFIILLILAVGILLFAFGLVTIFLAKKATLILDILYYYVIIKIFLWTSRVCLEFIYPVKLSMFYIEPFTIIVLPGLILELILFFIAMVLIRKQLLLQNRGEIKKTK